MRHLWVGLLCLAAATSSPARAALFPWYESSPKTGLSQGSVELDTIVPAVPPAFAESAAPPVRFLPAPQKIYGEFPLQKVIDTSSAPARLVGSTLWGCSGTLVGPRHVVTAGHCIQDDDGYWITANAFSPGRNGPATPHGTVPWKRAFVPARWVERRDRDYDFALVVLEEDVGDRIGWLPLAYDSRVTSTTARLVGYPQTEGGTQWQSACPVDKTSRAQWRYRCDTTSGMSGGPVIGAGPKSAAVVLGVHWGFADAPDNRGVQLTAESFAILEYWRKLAR